MTIDILALARKHLDQTNARCNTLDFIGDDADIIEFDNASIELRAALARLEATT